MNCFPCFQKKEEQQSSDGIDNLPVAQPKETPEAAAPRPFEQKENVQEPEFGEDDRATKNFTFRELAMATKNFRQECLLGEGGFGRIFKGTLKDSGQIVAVRQLDKNGIQQGGNDFVLEIAKLNLLEHRNLLRLVGYCADGDQRLLVYEYMPLGSLKNHLFDLPAGKKPLDWSTRMQIALGVAEGLEYLHEKADPPIIYRDLKSSNILLHEDNSPRLSEYGLVNLVQTGNKMHTPRVISHGYSAPEYEKHGELTTKSDVYSFGVVLLELISGRKALDPTRPPDEQSLVSWAQPYFRDQTKFADMADPLLRSGFSVTSLNQAVGVAAMCLQDEPLARPFISDLSAALNFLAMAPPEAPIPARLVPILSARVNSISQYSDNSISRKHENPGLKRVSENDKKASSDSSDNSDSDKEGKKNRPSSCTVSKPKSKKNKERSNSHAVSRKSRSSSLSSSGNASSLRCRSSLPDRSDSQDMMEESDDYEDSSGSDEESLE